MVTDRIIQDSPKAWLLASRPKTLTAAAVPVLIGATLAHADASVAGAAFNWPAATLCLLFAFIMQIDANFINDYFDFVNGTDDTERRLGPRRACAQGWVKPRSMKFAIAATTLIACAIGFPLIFYGGIEMILVGALCVLFCFLYTTFLSYIGLGDVLVFLFFGIVPVCVTYYIQTHTCPWTVWVAALGCGSVIDCLLLVNNYRDRDTDRATGKRTLIVALGEPFGRWFYFAQGVMGYVCAALSALDGHTWAALLPLFYVLPHFLTWRKMVQIRSGRALNRTLGFTSRNILLFGFLVAVSLLLA